MPEGINEEQLLAVYVDMNMGNLEQDFVLMGLPDPPLEPEEVAQEEPEPQPEPAPAEEGVPPEPEPAA